MKNKYIVLILIVISLVLLNGCNNNPDIIIENDNSFLSSFFIENNKVYIECELSVNNTTKINKSISFIGFFDKDVENGLLKEPRLYGYQKDKRTTNFHLKSGQQRISVIFIGDYAGNSQKYDRRLPSIKIIDNN